MQRKLFGTGVSLLLCAAALLPQDSSSVVGTVRDPIGAVVPGVPVTLHGPAGEERKTATGGNGDYVFTGLSSGRY